MNLDRLQKFDRWWAKNHHAVKAHTWLVKHTKRVMHNYNIAPEQFDHATKIIKRYNLSMYKRLNNKDAEFLWRLTHPSPGARHVRLLATAVFLQEKIEASGRKMGK